MNGYQLAQINISRFVRAKDDPANADFMAALDAVNAQAESSPGFVWRLVGDSNNATDVEALPGDPRLIVNMSLWQDLASLAAFAYKQPDHIAVLRRRDEWFETLPVSVAQWWVPAGHIPTVGEGMARIANLAANGPTERAFTFRQPFAAPMAECEATRRSMSK